MTLVLVVEDEKDLRNLVVDILTDAGYQVIEAEHGGVALDKAKDEPPDVILLDVMMPVMDGFEVLAQLRQNPATQATPVIMLTAYPPAKGELRAWKLGARHYIRKPFDPEQVELTVAVVLREAQTALEPGRADEGEDPFLKAGRVEEAEPPITTGNDNLDHKLGGGVPHESLALIEGPSSAGKSVLCQHFAHGSLQGGRGVAYITSENTVTSLSNKMESIGLYVANYLKSGELQIYPLDPSGPDPHPELALEFLAQGIERLPSHHQVIILDSISGIAANSQESAMLSFFSRCRRICGSGRTVILTIHQNIFEDKLLNQLRALCDAHFSLSVQNVGNKLVKVLEVRKVHSAELVTDNVFKFDVVPGIGMRVNTTTKIAV